MSVYFRLDLSVTAVWMNLPKHQDTRTQGKIPWTGLGFVHSARELTFYCRLYCQFCFGTQDSVRRQRTHLGTVQRLRSVPAIHSNDTVLGRRRRCPHVHEPFSFLLTKQKDLWKYFAQISGKACLVLTGGRWVCIPAYFFCWLSHGQNLKGQVNMSDKLLQFLRNVQAKLKPFETLNARD